MGARRGTGDLSPCRLVLRWLTGGHMNIAEASLQIPVTGAVLHADVVVPGQARAAVLFAHGSGRSRHSPPNRYVAAELPAAGPAPRLADLRTPAAQSGGARPRH